MQQLRGLPRKALRHTIPAEAAMMLEKPKEYTSLARAVRLSGLGRGTLRNQALAGRPRTVALARNHLTTRQRLHECLMAATDRSRYARRPLRAGYEPPTSPPRKRASGTQAIAHPGSRAL